MKTALLALAIAAGLCGADFEWTLPAGFPKPAVPADNPMTANKVELGRYLFYDRRISGNGQQSCSNCHRQELAFTDGRAQATGSTGKLHPRSSMSLVNVAYAPLLTWANPRMASLEEQVLGPMLGREPVELGLTGHESEFLDKLRADPVYQRLFPAAFPGGGELYTLPKVAQALAAFERSIVSMRSPYDKYRWGGQSAALSDSAKRGEMIFFSSERGGCFRCHGGWNFSRVQYEGSSAAKPPDSEDAGFFNTGVSTYEAPNRGLYEFTGRAEDMGKFRAPTLRNIAVTAPYMHDGSLATLDDVIDHYAAGGKHDSAGKSPILKKFVLSSDEKKDLVEFLRSLTDEELLHDPRWSDP